MVYLCDVYNIYKINITTIDPLINEEITNFFALKKLEQIK